MLLIPFVENAIKLEPFYENAQMNWTKAKNNIYISLA